ncbi:hypothetical protein Hypma_006081 [Hypsizygus marmoreus]|uniref:Uncharacterized protein n=1 Tax=Hypsizygus marmoreus TaxID=39966 RepID=A0A369K1W6_HYPMA|nr:hypothetical protein Hypma_006081 [Hypsizygus marmoreus]
MSDSSIDEFQRQIDQRIIAHDEASRALRRQRNAIVPPIARLLPELLCRVFEYFREFYQYHFGYLTDIQWIRITHVSSKWRETALACPSLWNDIQMQFGPTWVQEMLIRSKGAPLSFTGIINDDNIPTIERLSQHTGRLHALSLTSRSPAHSVHLANLMADTTAPFMIALVIAFDLPRALSGALLLGPTPNSCLRRMALRNCILPWDQFRPMHSLTTLRISFTFPLEAIPSVSQIVAILRQTPLLTALVLKRALLGVPDQSVIPPAQRTVNLMHLEELHIESDIAECCALLNHLTFPPLTRFVIDCSVPLAPQNPLRLLIPSLKYWSDLLRDQDDIDLRIIEMTTAFELDHELVLQLSPAVVAPFLLDLRLRIEDEDVGDQFFADFETVLGVLPLENVCDLHIHDLPAESPLSESLHFFMHMRKLETIHVRGNDAINRVMTSLFSRIPIGENGNEWNDPRDVLVSLPYSYPALSYLEIWGYHFGDGEIALLYNALQLRRQMQQGLDYLYLRACNFTPGNQTDILQHVVHELIVD